MDKLAKGQIPSPAHNCVDHKGSAEPVHKDGGRAAARGVVQLVCHGEGVTLGGEDEDEESLDLENRPKTKTKILLNFEKSLKTFEDRNFFEDIRRIEDFQKNLKVNVQFKKYIT